MPKLTYKLLAAVFFTAAIILRVLLYWVNPPENAFDDHFEPIFLIMDSGTNPAKDACWQCYHPPVFYWLSAMTGKVAVAMGVTFPHLLKLLQFLPCLYGLLTVGIIYLILKKLPLSDFSRLMAFGAVCFLPRHIYMSAMNSNDTISYLFVALSVYLLLIAIERKLAPVILLATSVVISVALFTKYTALVVLPVVLVVFGVLWYTRRILPRTRVVIALALVLLLPVSLFSIYVISNVKHYGSPLPWNVTRFDPALAQPRDGSRLDFLSFKPWESLSTPIIVPGQMHSYWTLVYSGMWFDNEPKYLYLLDSNRDWWTHYYGWLRGEERFPEGSPPISGLTRLTGAGLIALGLVPLLLIVTGFYQFFRRGWTRWSLADGTDAVKMSLFPALLVSNAAGMMALAFRLPVYSAAKAAYFLNSLPAFAVFLALGLMTCETHHAVKWSILTVFVLSGALVSLHILQIVRSLI